MLLVVELDAIIIADKRGQHLMSIISSFMSNCVLSSLLHFNVLLNCKNCVSFEENKMCGNVVTECFDHSVPTVTSESRPRRSAWPCSGAPLPHMCAQKISDAPLFNKSWSLILFFAPRRGIEATSESLLLESETVTSSARATRMVRLRCHSGLHAAAAVLAADCRARASARPARGPGGVRVTDCVARPPRRPRPRSCFCTHGAGGGLCS